MPTALTDVDMSNVTIPYWLETTARNHPDKLALEFDGERWTFRELRCQVNDVADWLASACPDVTGRIGILSPNRPGIVFVAHAAMQLGVPFVPLNWRLSPTELAWQIRDANIAILVADEAREASIVHVTPELTVIPISVPERAPPKSLPSPCAQGQGLGLRVNLASEAALLYTSGTSGRPKGAILTSGAFWFSAIASALHLGQRADDVWLAVMPLFHVGGLAMLFRSVIGAVPLILHDRFDPERVLDAIDDGATLVSLVPAMFERLLALRPDKPWPPHLRCVLLGGGAAPPRLIQEATRLGIPIAPTYGLTETASQVATLLPDQALDHPGSSGLPLPLTEVRIMTSGGESSSGAVGDIEVRGPTVFSGYLAQPPRDRGAWFPTGDIGYLDADGYVYVVDRRDDLIVSGGENIYPAEIERVLLAHPLVADAGVIDIPHERWGSRPVAAIVWRGDPSSAESELRRTCLSELASFKVPDRFALVPELPRSASGKLLRRHIAALLGQHSSDAHDDEGSVPFHRER